MRATKEKVRLTLDEDLLEEFRMQAEICNRSLSQYVTLVLN